MDDERRFYLVNVEPYTSELYNNLLQPAFSAFEEKYVTYGKKSLTRENLYKTLCIAPIKGCFFGAWRSLFKTAWFNMNQDYEALQDPRPPKDIFFMKYYTNPRKYKDMLRGYKPELKIEVIYQMCRQSLATYAKYLVPSKSDSFVANVGISLGRAFTTSFITASTVYPLAMHKIGHYDTEVIIKKTIRKAGSGSLRTALINVGMQMAKSIMPSWGRIIKVQQALLGA